MAIVYPQATLTPSKRDLMDAWLPTRSWYDGHADRKPVGSFRFDDPAGEVGWKGSCSAPRACRRCSCR